jgi:hypothetical protein
MKDGLAATSHAVNDAIAQANHGCERSENAEKTTNQENKSALFPSVNYQKPGMGITVCT